MSSEDQNRIINDVFHSVTTKRGALDKRLSYLESSEYAILHYYGSMFQFNLGTVIAIAVAGTYYPITAMATGLVNGFTFGGGASLTCGKPGVYRADYNVSFSGMVANITKTALTINSVVQQSTVSRTLSGTANDLQHLSGAGIFRLVLNDVINLEIANETDADDPTINYASVTLNRVGD